MNRREALLSLGALAVSGPISSISQAKELDSYPERTAITHESLPNPARKDKVWQVLIDEEDRKTLAVVFDRFIPSDEYGPSATEAGCLVFLDNQLSGDYGAGASMYLDGPYDLQNEEKIMGFPQFIATPKDRYISGLKALQSYSYENYRKPIYELSNEQIDSILSGMEDGSISLGDTVNTKAFFELMLQNVREGYLADPIYGGNKDMVGWKMIGFPGARYDYRPYIDRRGEDLKLIPVSLVPEY